MTVACYLWSSASLDRARTRGRKGLERWLVESGIDPRDIEWYSERASAPAQGRPELARLEQDIASGNVTTVLLWRLTDLVTRFRAVVTTLASWCERGVRVIVVSQRIDLGPEAQGTAALLRALGETELEFRRERQQRGIATAKARGAFPGRKLGTTKEKPHRAMELRGKGLTAKEIAETLGVSERTVFRYLGTSEEKKRPVARKGAKS